MGYSQQHADDEWLNQNTQNMSSRVKMCLAESQDFGFTDNIESIRWF